MTKIKSNALAESYYIPDPPRFRRSEINSSLIDSQDMANYVADTVLWDLARLNKTAVVTIKGNQELRIGQTIEVIDDYLTEHTVSGVVYYGMKYFLYDFSSTHDSTGYTMNLTLVGGDGPPTPYMRPVAAFTYIIDIEYLQGTAYAFVYTDASNSYDPDSPLDDLSFTWESAGFPNGSGITNCFPIPDYVASGIIVVKLTVEDNSPIPLTNSTTRIIDLNSNSEKIASVICVASENEVYTTINGGLVWRSTTLT